MTTSTPTLHLLPVLPGCVLDTSLGGITAHAVVQTVPERRITALVNGAEEYGFALSLARTLRVRALDGGRGFSSYAVVESLHSCACGASHLIP